MIDLKSALKIKHESALVFTDYSSRTVNFDRDLVNIDLLNTDFIYVGFRKQINAIYFNHVTDYVNEGTLTLEVYNGSSWIAATGLSDDTLGLKRSGFIRFDREQKNQVSNTVNGDVNYWYRIKSSEERLALSISGINLVFADDYSLMLEQPYVTTPEFLSTLSSHILVHVAVRNEILQSFRSKDFIKYDSNGVKQDLNAWDLLEIEEIVQAAVCLAISKIYFNMSDNNDDVWSSKSLEYRARYEKLIQTVAVSLDLNDDGKSSVTEVKSSKINSTHMSR